MVESDDKYTDVGLRFHYVFGAAFYGAVTMTLAGLIFLLVALSGMKRDGLLGVIILYTMFPCLFLGVCT